MPRVTLCLSMRLLALGAVLLAAPAFAQEAAPPMILHPSELHRVDPARLTQTVRFSGTVEPSRQVELSAQVGGIAEQVLAQVGERVEEGQILIEIATSDLQLQLEAQQASLASTRVQLDSALAALARVNSLSASGVASRTTLDDAQSQVDVLESSILSLEVQVRLAETNLSRATIRAPFAGVVSARNVEAGQLVGAGNKLISIVDLSSVSVEAVAPIIDTLDLAVGQTALLTLPGEAREPMTAAVERINPVADTGTRSLRFYLTLPNPDGLLRGGTFLTGLIELRVAEGALAVPRDAVQRIDGAPQVIVVRDGHAVAQPVDLGPEWSSGALVQILGGLAPGETVVAMPLRGLAPGAAVTVGE